MKNTPHSNLKIAVTATPDTNLDEAVQQITALAHEQRERAVLPDVLPLRFGGRAVLLADTMALLLAFVTGGFLAWAANIYILADGFQQLISATSAKQFILFMALGGTALLWLDQQGHYRMRVPFWESIGHIVTVACVGLLLGGFIQYAAKHDFSRLWLGSSWVLFALFLFSGRMLVRRWLRWRGRWHIPTLLVGAGTAASATKAAVTGDSSLGYQIIAEVSPARLQQVESQRDWQKLLLETGARQVMIALEGDALQRCQPALKALARGRTPFTIVPPWLGLPVAGLKPHSFFTHDAVLLHNTNRLSLPLPRLLKRSFDIVVAGTALVALAPLFLVVMLLIKRDGGAAFFAQPRVGQHGKTFKCYKFRSMIVNAEQALQCYLASNPDAAVEWQLYQKLRHDPRITAVGHFIRKTSIDELPQLLNVLRGDMSLVGPRPMLLSQQSLYGDDLVYYTAVKPGLTGVWQVSGRNALSFEERVRLEAWYARNWSMWMDIVILLKTPKAVLASGQTA